MLYQDVKTLADRVNDLYNRHDLATLAALHAPDFKFHSSTLPGGVTDKEGWKAMMAMVWQAFPDLHNELQDEVIAGDTVVMRLAYSGTHLGEFAGIPPTGKRATAVVGIDVSRYENGMVEEKWLETNELALLQEVGVPPAAVAEAAAAITAAKGKPISRRGPFGGPDWGVG